MRAETTYGCIGVKVWIFKGEVLGGLEQANAPVAVEEPVAKPARKRGGKSQEARG
jgi:small subunit ribosomal protein S3